MTFGEANQNCILVGYPATTSWGPAASFTEILKVKKTESMPPFYGTTVTLVPTAPWWNDHGEKNRMKHDQVKVVPL